MHSNQLIKAIEESLTRYAEDFERLSDQTEDEALWGVEVNESASGFISLEKNDFLDDYVLTFSLSLGSVEDLSREDLLELLLLNRDLPGSCLTVTPPFSDSPEQFLLLYKMAPARDFQPDTIPRQLDHLQDLMESFFGE
ncbi:MAG: hypothetical protein ACOC0U_04355 [Desulfovibrionales bacterium]